MLTSLTESIAGERDPIERLCAVVMLDEIWQHQMTALRDESAYEARRMMASADIEAATEFDRQRIEYWARRHRAATGAPALGRHRRIDTSRDFDARS